MKTFEQVPLGELFYSRHSGTRAQCVKLGRVYSVREGESRREQPRQMNAVLFGIGEPVTFSDTELVTDITKPLQPDAAVMLRKTFFVDGLAVTAVSTNPDDSGRLFLVPLRM